MQFQQMMQIDEPFAGLGHFLVSLSACRNSRGLPTATTRVKTCMCSRTWRTLAIHMSNTGLLGMLWRVWTPSLRAPLTQQQELIHESAECAECFSVELKRQI